jgi:hypothetical protein
MRNSYFNERPISTQQTGWNFVGQSRAWLPPALSGLLWFGVDDSATTVRFPIYGSANKVPLSFAGKGAQDGITTPMMSFDTTKAFVVFNLVANFCYYNWNLVYSEVQSKIVNLESEFSTLVTEVDAKALELFNNGDVSDAIDYVTDFSENLGNKLVSDWYQFFGELFLKYKDGYIMNKSTENKQCGCQSSSANYPQRWYDAIASSTGNHYMAPLSESKMQTLSTYFKLSSMNCLSIWLLIGRPPPFSSRTRLSESIATNTSSPKLRAYCNISKCPRCTISNVPFTNTRVIVDYHLCPHDSCLPHCLVY